MQVQHIGYRIRGFYRVAALGYLWDMTPKDAQRLFEILRFFDKHGLAATRDAFGVSRRTLYPNLGKSKRHVLLGPWCARHGIALPSVSKAVSSKPTSPGSLKERSIQRWYTYPKTPKMNAHAERFHRTIQESFVDDHEDLLFTDLALFNRKLADWLVFYNTERPHHSLSQQSPLSFLLKDQPECQRYWTHAQR